jgi:mannitol-1-phosphate 5-dehydrogenase
MAGKSAIHFGGGNIGRGFVAEKLSLSGYEVSGLHVYGVRRGG